MGFIEALWLWFGATGFLLAIFFLVQQITHAELKGRVGYWLWSKGGEGKGDLWQKHVVELFDRVYGREFLSLRFISISLAVSVFGVALTMVFMGLAASTSFLRLPLFVNVLIANVVPDYLSLLQTRLIFGWLAKGRGLFASIGLILADYVGTTIIYCLVGIGFIWLTTVFWVENFGSGGIFPHAWWFIFSSVISFISSFYTTMFTSAYIIAGISLRVILKAFHPDLSAWIDFETQPFAIMGGYIALAFSLIYWAIYWAIYWIV